MFAEQPQLENEIVEIIKYQPPACLTLSSVPSHPAADRHWPSVLQWRLQFPPRQRWIFCRTWTRAYVRMIQVVARTAPSLPIWSACKMLYLIGLSWSTSRSPGPGLGQLPVLHVDLLINHNCTKLVQFGILNEEYLHQDLTISGTKATRRQLAATREMSCLQFTHPETRRFQNVIDNNKLRPHLKSFPVRVGCGWRGKVFLRLQLDLMSALVYQIIIPAWSQDSWMQNLFNIRLQECNRVCVLLFVPTVVHHLSM